MNTKHTPGLQATGWHISHEANGTFIRTANGGLVCSLEAGNQEMRNKHATLIAAAPTMLEQLKEAARLMVYYRPRDKYPDGSVIQGISETCAHLFTCIAMAEGRDPGEGIADAEAAIAKAEGRS